VKEKMRKISGLIMVILAVWLTACPHSTVIVTKPGQRVYISGFGTNAGTIRAAGEFDVFEVTLQATLEQIAVMFQDYPNMSVEISSDGGLRVIGGGVSNRRTPPAPNGLVQNGYGVLVIRNFTRVSITVKITDANSKSQSITVAPNSANAVALPAGNYTFQIGDNTESITIAAGSVLEKKINPR
jgi:hypothetical protein